MLPQLTAIFGRIAVLVDRVGKPDEGADFLSVLQQFDRANAPSADQSAPVFFGVAEAGSSPEEGGVEPMVTVKTRQILMTSSLSKRGNLIPCPNLQI